MKHKTLIAKTLSYKALTTVFLVALAWWRLDVSLCKALLIGGGDAVFKMCLYFGHEYIWTAVLRRGMGQ